MRLMTAFVVVCIVMCGLARAQEKTSLPDNVARELDYYVGEWTVEGEMAGKMLKGQWSARWAAHKHCILIHSLLELGDEKIATSGVSGWDAASEQIVTVQSVSNGVIEETRYKIAAPGVLKGVYSISAQGEPLKVDCEVKTQQPNEWTFKSSASLFAREKENDFTLRFIRSENKPQDEQLVPPVYEHLKDLEAYVGNWVAEDALPEDTPGFAAKGDKVTYHASVQWVHNKAILQMDFVTSTADGKTIDARWNFGWDAVNKKIVYSGFDSVGGRVWGETKKVNADKWIWENKWSDAEGKQGSGTGTTTMLDNNNTHIHEFTNAVFEGKPQPDGKLVYKRLK